MKFVVRRYYSGFCTYETEADNEDQAYEIAQGIPIDYDEILRTLESWKECDQVELEG